MFKGHKADFARPDLDVYLPNLYRTESDLIVLFLCDDYAKKRWCKLEWRFIRQLIATADEGRIMFLSFDNIGAVPEIGILNGDGYLSIAKHSPNEITEFILMRLAQNEGKDENFYTTGLGSAPCKRSNSGAKQGSSTETTLEDSLRSANQPTFHGLQRKALYEKLQGTWFGNGPCVAILQGFPGCGKTQLASALVSKDRIVLDPISVELGSSDPSLDLLLNLAANLQDHGIGELNAEIDKGVSGDLYDALLKVLRRERILIIVDEFQCVLDDANAQPPPQWQKLIESLNNSARAEGRLLLISNRSIGIERWSEKCPIHEIKGFSNYEAATFLAQLLEEKGLASRVPTERLEELGRRLGGNPRAIRTLVGSLKFDALEDLLPAIPSLESIGDVVLAKELLDKFERDLIARTIPNLGDDVASFMRWLAVNRRPITKAYYAELTKAFKDSKALRASLFDRFFLELTQSGDQMHPLAREVCVTRLRLANPEWRKAHSLAADYHLQAFRSSQASSCRHVAASFSELRHHLVESGRTGELYNASVRMTKFVLSRIPNNTRLSMLTSF